MSFNDIQLNDYLLTELYRRALVVTETDPKAPASTPAPPAETAAAPATPASAAPPQKTVPAILGSNQKQVTIIVHYTNAVHLPDEQLEFLSSMLTACKLSLADVAIHNFHAGKGLVANDITTALRSQTVLLFGVSPDQFGLPIQFPPFQVQPLAGITYLYSPELEYYKTTDPQETRNRKMQLWNCLKLIFRI